MTNITLEKHEVSLILSALDSLEHSAKDLERHRARVGVGDSTGYDTKMKQANSLRKKLWATRRS